MNTQSAPRGRVGTAIQSQGQIGRENALRMECLTGSFPHVDTMIRPIFRRGERLRKDRQGQTPGQTLRAQLPIAFPQCAHVAAAAEDQLVHVGRWPLVANLLPLDSEMCE